MADRVLVLGSGAREHILAWKLAQSSHVKKVFVAPGNAGTADNGKISNSAVSISNRAILTQFCKDHNIGLVVVGSEEPLAGGVVNHLTSAGVKCFGPTAKAAKLEADKSFSKSFMDRHGISTARWKAFTDPHEACGYITCADFSAMVVKANGLTSKSGQIIAENKDEACKAVQDLTQDKTLATATKTIIVEERLEGEELSCLCFSDGISIAAMPPAKEHKRLLEGDQGPITEGMGAYCPAPQFPRNVLEKIEDTILQQTVDGLRQEDAPYVGVLHARVMLTKEGPKVLQFKCCFGETACQVILPLLKNDLYEVIQATIDGRLHSFKPVWLEKKTAVCIFMASPGYPDHRLTGLEIKGLPQAKELGLEVFHAATAMRNGKVVTNGGRVLAVTAVAKDAMSALQVVTRGIETIQFPGALYRKDIGAAFTQKSKYQKEPDSSESEAINIPLICAVKPLAVDAAKAGYHMELRRLAASFHLKPAGYSDPILISHAYAVGDRLEVAQACNKYETIGLDLVAMCAIDIVARGAAPLYFLGLFACGVLSVGAAEEIAAGITRACKKLRCAHLATLRIYRMLNFPLTGLDNAVGMAAMQASGQDTLTGFMVGAVERGQLLPHLDQITEGDLLIGIASSGFHSNEFSLICDIFQRANLRYSSPAPHPKGTQTCGELLLTPAKINSSAMLPVLRSGHVKACSPITGGGLLKNMSRFLPESLGIVLDAHCWKIPEIFAWLQKEGDFTEEEMVQTFNCGVGAVLVVQKEMAEKILKDVRRREEAWLIGSVVTRQTGSPQTEVYNLLGAIQGDPLHPQPSTADGQKSPIGPEKAKVAVLISGTGSHLDALINSTKESESCAQVSLVISNRFGLDELKKAARIAIATRVMDHKLFGSRAEYDGTLNKVLEDFSIDLICLSGFMRTLTGPFVQKWKGKILNIHPSLLPSFKGVNAQKQALRAGVRVTGCTVHFVLDETNNDAIILQEAVTVELKDTEETLSERVKEAELRAFPAALQLVASGVVRLGDNGRICWRTED